MKPLKRTGQCKVFIDSDRRETVTFGPAIQTVEGKLLSNLMKRLPKAHPKENQTNQKQQASEANRRVQFNKETEVQTLLKGNQQSKSKQQPANQGNPTRISTEELQSTAHTYDKKLQELKGRS